MPRIIHSKETPLAKRLSVALDLRLTDTVSYADLEIMVSVDKEILQHHVATMKTHFDPTTKKCVCQYADGQKVYLCRQCAKAAKDYYERWSIRMKQALSVIDGHNRSQVQAEVNE